MKNYEKPVVMVNEGLAEGVYAASGDCWSVEYYKLAQDGLAGDERVFEIKIVHSNQVEHITKSSTIVLTFSDVIHAARTDASSCTFSGSTVTVTRTAHGNAYQTGDQATFKVWVKAATNELSAALTCTGAKVTFCEKSVNVQGNGGNE